MLLLFSCEKKEKPYDVCQTYPLEIEIFGPFESHEALRTIDSLALLSEFKEPQSVIVDKRSNYYIIELTNLSSSDSIRFCLDEQTNYYFLEWSLFRTDSLGYLHFCTGSACCDETKCNQTLLPNMNSYHLLYTTNLVAKEGDIVVAHSLKIEPALVNNSLVSEKLDAFTLKKMQHPIFTFISKNTKLVRADVCLLDINLKLRETETYYEGKDSIYKLIAPCKNYYDEHLEYKEVW